MLLSHNTGDDATEPLPEKSTKNARIKTSNSSRSSQKTSNTSTYTVPITSSSTSTQIKSTISKSVEKTKEFDRSKLEISTNVIGEGSFGEVYLGEYYKLPVAIKKLKRSRIGERAIEDFKNEVAILVYVINLLRFLTILRTLQHNFIVSCYGYSLDDNPIVVLEYMSHGKYEFQSISPIHF